MSPLRLAGEVGLSGPGEGWRAAAPRESSTNRDETLLVAELAEQSERGAEHHRDAPKPPQRPEASATPATLERVSRGSTPTYEFSAYGFVGAWAHSGVPNHLCISLLNGATTLSGSGR